VRRAREELAADGLSPIVVDWRCDGREIAVIHDFAEQADRYLRARGLARLSIEGGLRSQDPAFLERLTDTYHQCGGLRMAASPQSGVVDPQCRVWDTSNVWIAGAAVFPSSSFANCTLTALALTARLADQIEL
jgi:choline dehydrogenase-like flavoprotein